MIEILVVIGIFGALASAALVSFHKSQDRRALEDAQATVYRTLERQRNKALTGSGLSNHGTRIEEHLIAAFEGDAYAGGGNEIFLPGAVSLDPAGIDIVFKRMSGETLAGTAVVTITHANGNSAQISVSADGLIDKN